ncbi:MAG: hypothetical protein RLY86_4181 [Pseudomonadota bacterium]
MERKDAERRRSILGVGVAASALLLLSACGHDLPTIDTETVRIAAAAGANADSPVKVALVFALDADAMQTVSTLSAADWFRDANDPNDIVRAHPAGFRVSTYEVAPLHSATHAVTDEEEEAVAAFVFARYQGPGTHRARIDRLESPTIRLGPTFFTIDSAEN